MRSSLMRRQLYLRKHEDRARRQDPGLGGQKRRDCQEIVLRLWRAKAWVDDDRKMTLAALGVKKKSPQSVRLGKRGMILVAHGVGSH